MGKHGGSRGETPRMSIGNLHRNWLWLTFVHRYYGCHGPVGYPGARRCPVYLQFCLLLATRRQNCLIWLKRNMITFIMEQCQTKMHSKSSNLQHCHFGLKSNKECAISAK